MGRLLVPDSTVPDCGRAQPFGPSTDPCINISVGNGRIWDSPTKQAPEIQVISPGGLREVASVACRDLSWTVYGLKAMLGLDKGSLATKLHAAVAGRLDSRDAGMTKACLLQSSLTGDGGAARAGDLISQLGRVLARLKDHGGGTA